MVNEFKYNGKEQQEQTFNYDYGFRQLDPQLGRWHSPDLLAEQFYSESPYSYAGNNPVSNVDVAGLLWMSTPQQGHRNAVYVGTALSNGLSGLFNNSSTGSSSNGYTYDWATGQYTDSEGYYVSWAEVSNNFVKLAGNTITFGENGMTGFYNSTDGNINRLVLDGILDVTFGSGVSVSSVIPGLIASIAKGDFTAKDWWSKNNTGSVTSYVGILGEAMLSGGKNNLSGLKILGNIGRVTGVLGETIALGISAYNVWKEPSAMNYGKLAVDIATVSLNVIPKVGSALSFVVGAINAEGGFDDYYYNLEKTGHFELPLSFVNGQIISLHYYDSSNKFVVW